MVRVERSARRRVPVARRLASLLRRLVFHPLPEVMAVEKSVVRSVRFSPEEWARVEGWAADAQVSPSRYVREAALRRRPQAKPRGVRAEAVVELNRVGRSLNQLVRLAHQARRDAAAGERRDPALGGRRRDGDAGRGGGRPVERARGARPGEPAERGAGDRVRGAPAGWWGPRRHQPGGLVIASTSSSASFGALGSYLERGKGGVPAEERVAWVESRGVVRDVDGAANAERAARVMEATADRTPQCAEPCYHVSISFDTRDLPGGPTDPTSKELMLGVARDTLRDLGLDQHQVVVVAHGDRDHPHMHLMVNRVHPETGKTWDRWQDRVRLEKSLRAQERARGFREVPGQLGRLEGQERPPRSPSRGAYRSAEREAAAQGRRSLQHEARAEVGYTFERAKTWEELETTLAGDGYVLRAKGRGLVLRDGDGREVKASAVSRAGGRGQLETRLGEGYREHRAAVVARTGPVPDGLSPHGQAVVRAHRDLEAAREHQAAVTAAQKRLRGAERSVHGLTAQEQEVRAAWTEVQRGLAATYQDPAGAERLFVALSRTEGTARAAEALARQPERFGTLRQEAHRTLGIVTRRTDDPARAAATVTARDATRYSARRTEWTAERERAPRALRESKAGHRLARARAEARPGVSAAERRLEGLVSALSRGDQKALERVAPAVSKGIEPVVARLAKRALERDLGLGR